MRLGFLIEAITFTFRDQTASSGAAERPGGPGLDPRGMQTSDTQVVGPLVALITSYTD